MEGAIVQRSCLVKHVVVFLADVKLASDNGFDAFFVSRIDEMHGSKNIAMIGHGHGRHPELFHAMDKLFDVAGAVKERVIGMEMQVDELIAHWRTGADIGSSFYSSGLAKMRNAGEWCNPGPVVGCSQ